MLKISVIGTGHLGSIHAKLLAQQSRAELCGIYDIDTDRATTLANELSTIAFPTIQEAIQSSHAAIIAVPTSEHFSVAKQCITKGVHVLIEKPITHSYKSAEELLTFASTTNSKTVIQVGHVERFNPAVVAAMKFHDTPLFIEAHRLSQFRPRATDVSVIHDLMIHDIDILLWLVNSPIKSVNANGVAIITTTPDIANARIEFENGTVANLTASRISASPQRKMRIFQKQAYLSLDFSVPSIECYRILDTDVIPDNATAAIMLGSIDSIVPSKNIIYEKPEIIPTNALVEEQRTFIESILDSTPISVTARSATDSLKIAEEIHACVIRSLPN